MKPTSSRLTMAWDGRLANRTYKISVPLMNCHWKDQCWWIRQAETNYDFMTGTGYLRRFICEARRFHVCNNWGYDDTPIIRLIDYSGDLTAKLNRAFSDAFETRVDDIAYSIEWPNSIRVHSDKLEKYIDQWFANRGFLDYVHSNKKISGQ